jgi:hypothetical protein
MRFLVGVALVIILLVGAFKLLGWQVPILDYPFGGPMSPPRIEIIDPDDIP